MRLTRALGVATAAAAILAASASPAERVFGGTVVQIQSAPWSVLIQVQVGGPTRYNCTGAVLDASRIVTAAHCLYDDSGHVAAPSAVTIRAGVSNYLNVLATDAEQDRTVSSFRIHPAYRWTAEAGPDDVAVLALSTPLDLSGPTVQALALPAAGSGFPAGATATLAAFGRQNPTIATNGRLNSVTTTVQPQGVCNAAGSKKRGLIEENAVQLCAASPTSAVCDGDSGGALVSATGSPTLIGVVSGVILNASSSSCRAGAAGIFAFVAAPEILQFLSGDDDPPRAPRDTESTLVLKVRLPLLVGGTPVCSSGGWSGRPQRTYSFVNAVSGKVLQSGRSTRFTVPSFAVGAKLACEVAAVNAGGTALEETAPTAAVRPASRLSRR